MACAVCGSRAHGEFRGHVGLLGFCREHYEEARKVMPLPPEKWPDKFIEVRIRGLSKERSDAIRDAAKLAHVNGWEAGGRILSLIGGNASSQLRWLNIDGMRNAKGQQARILIEDFDRRIGILESTLEKRKEKQEAPTPRFEKDSGGSQNDPEKILKIRLAKGEITREEFEETMRLIRGS